MQSSTDADIFLLCVAASRRVTWTVSFLLPSLRLFFSFSLSDEWFYTHWHTHTYTHEHTHTHRHTATSCVLGSATRSIINTVHQWISPRAPRATGYKKINNKKEFSISSSSSSRDIYAHYFFFSISFIHRHHFHHHHQWVCACALDPAGLRAVSRGGTTRCWLNSDICNGPIRSTGRPSPRPINWLHLS